MKTFYSLVCFLLFSASIFAQNAVTNTISNKVASKSEIATSKPEHSPNNVELRSAAFACDTSFFYCEDFEGVTAPNLPGDMNTSSLEENYFIPVNGSTQEVQGFFTGNSTDAGAGGYWTYVDDHSQFAMTNDDSCLPGGASPNEDNNCSLNFEVLELPMFDFSQADTGMWLQFEFYHDKNWGGGDAMVEVSNDGGANWNELSGNLPDEQSWQSAAYSLSEYNLDSSVVIRFVWSDNNSWASGFAVDNITVNPLPEYSVRLDEVYYLTPSSYNGGATYKTIPLDQIGVTNFTFGGVIQNMGLNVLDSARLYSDVASEGFSSQSNGINTASLDYDTLYCNDVFTPSATGTFQVSLYSTDVNETTTETISEDFVVSTNEYARDDFDFSGGYQGGYYVNRAGSGQLGNVFDIYQDATLYAIKARINPNTSPTSVAKAVLSKVNGDLTSVFGGANDNPPADPNAIEYLTESSSVNVGQNSSDWINFMFNPPVQLTAGDVVYAGINAAYTGADTVIIGYTGGTDIGTSLWQDIDGVTTGGNANDWYYFDNAVMVRLNFDPNATGPVSVEENEKTAFNVYPNPNNGIFNISTSSVSDQKIEIKNMLGQLVYSRFINGNTQIDLSNYDKGVYTISLIDENELSSSKKIIIQ